MALQFIHDNKGNTTGVYIPIEDWQELKAKYIDLQKAEAESNAPRPWQIQILEERLSDYNQSKGKTTGFDETVDEIEKML